MTNLPGRGCEDYPTAPYPGEIPAGAYFIDDGVVHLIDGGAAGRELVDALEAAAAVPILTYGSNACPGRLAEKFGVIEGVEAISAIAVLPCVVSGVRRAWACEVNSRAAVPHTLVSAPGSSMEGHVLLIPEKYLNRMDETEGRMGSFYAAARLPGVTVTLAKGYVWASPVTYLGIGRRGPLGIDGIPAFSDVMAEREARELIESRRGSCADEFLPAFEVIDPAVSLSNIAHPPLADFLSPR